MEWFPAGSSLVEQGGPSTTMYVLLSGKVEIRREDEAGRVRVVDSSGPREFIGEAGIATRSPRNAHVAALDDVTALTLWPPTPYLSTDEPARATCSSPGRYCQGTGRLPVTTRIDVSDFVGHKIRATAAHRSQHPIGPSTFPEPILQGMFGVEHFVEVLPERPLRTSLLDD